MIRRPPRSTLFPYTRSSDLLGTAVEPNGTATVRAIGQQYSFTPSCILVPAETPITLRATSADVVHGILIQGTNVNTMLVPDRSEEHTSELQSQSNLVCRLLL